MGKNFFKKVKETLDENVKKYYDEQKEEEKRSIEDKIVKVKKENEKINIKNHTIKLINIIIFLFLVFLTIFNVSFQIEFKSIYLMMGIFTIICSIIMTFKHWWSITIENETIYVNRIFKKYKIEFKNLLNIEFIDDYNENKIGVLITYREKNKIYKKEFKSEKKGYISEQDYLKICNYFIFKDQIEQNSKLNNDANYKTIEKNDEIEEIIIREKSKIDDKYATESSPGEKWLIRGGLAFLIFIFAILPIIELIKSFNK